MKIITCEQVACGHPDKICDQVADAIVTDCLRHDKKARVAIEVETKAALADLQGSIADLSVDVASRMVANDLSDDEHRAIIERYVSEAGSFHAN